MVSGVSTYILQGCTVPIPYTSKWSIHITGTLESKGCTQG